LKWLRKNEVVMNDKTKKWNSKEGQGRGRLLRRPVLIAAAALVVIGAALITVSRSRRYTWYVEEGLESAWSRVLARAGVPKGFNNEINIIKSGAPLPPDAEGFFITTRRAAASEMVTVYPRLSFDLEYAGAHVLALDPWMIFRDHRRPALMRERVAEGGEGKLLLPGRDEGVINAWTAQLVRDREGAFPADRAAWDKVRNSLFHDKRFFRGSATLNWQDAWFFLAQEEAAWVYAPLSRVRELPNFRSSMLEASVFPAPGNGIGLQARILWAIPQGNAKTLDRLKKEPLAWLKNPAHQTIMADALEWLPADPDGEPFDPSAMTAKRAWLTASFVWELNE
jgi:hypothetical protein